MLTYLGVVALGLVLLMWSADRFVREAAGLARALGISTLIVGLTVVAMGTSAPELLVSTMAAIQQSPGIAVGNAIGSNIANMSLVLGAAALCAPLTVQSLTLRREFPVLALIMLLATALLANAHLGRLDGLILLSGLVGLMFWLVWLGRHSEPDDPLTSEYIRSVPEQASPATTTIWLLVSLLVMLASAQMLVWGATQSARALGVSELVIGLSIVAVGTSLPELATSVAGALRREYDIAIGNVLGSNMFNTLAVLAIPGLIAPGALPVGIVSRDLPAMLAITALLYFMCRGWPSPRRITRAEGAWLLGLFAGYQAYLFWSA